MTRDTSAAVKTKSGSSHPVPFDSQKLDSLMDEAGIDALIVTSKHNIQYLLGGYRFFTLRKQPR